MALTLKQIFRPISYLIYHFDDIPQDLLGETNALLAGRPTLPRCRSIFSSRPPSA